MDQVAYPKKLTITLTDRCNLKCFICSRDEFESSVENKGQHLGFDKLDHMEEAIRHAEMISLTGFGESFLHAQLHEVLDYIYARNARDNLIMLISNGTALSEEHARKLGPRLRELVISLNASNPQAYQRDMHPEVNKLDFNGERDPRVRLEKLDGKSLSQFEKTCGKIRDFMRGLAPEDRKKVRLHYVVHRDNIAEMEEFVLVAKSLGATFVGFYHYLVTQESRIDYSIYFHKQAYGDAFERVRGLGRALGIAVDGARFGTQQPAPYDKELHCGSPFDEAIVNTSGLVSPCCHAGTSTQGNAFEAGFDAIWFGQKYRMLREERYLEACQPCNQYRTIDDVDVHFHPVVKTSAAYKRIFDRIGSERRKNPLKLLVVGAGGDGSRSLRSVIEALCAVNGAEGARVRHESDSYAMSQALMHRHFTREDSRVASVLAAWRSDAVVSNNLASVMPVLREVFGPELRVIHLKRSRDAGVRALVNQAKLYPQHWGGYTAMAEAHDIVRLTARHFREMDAAEWARLGLEQQIGWYYDKNHALIEAARPEFPRWLDVATESLSDPATIERIAAFIDPSWKRLVPPVHLNAASVFDLAKVPDVYDRIRLARLVRDFDLNHALASDSYPIQHFVESLRSPVGRSRAPAVTAARLKAVHQQIEAWIQAALRGDAAGLPAQRNAGAFRRIRGLRLPPEQQIRLEQMVAGFDMRRLATDEGYLATFFVERLIAPHVDNPAMYPELAAALQPIADQLRGFVLRYDAGAFADEPREAELAVSAA